MKEELDKYTLEERENARKERIRVEIDKLHTILENLDVEIKKSVISLINNAAFMIVTLEDLQKETNQNGVLQRVGLTNKKSPAVEMYNVTIKNHMAIMKQLVDLLPKGFKIPDDEFDKLLSKRL